MIDIFKIFGDKAYSCKRPVRRPSNHEPRRAVSAVRSGRSPRASPWSVVAGPCVLMCVLRAYAVLYRTWILAGASRYELGRVRSTGPVSVVLRVHTLTQTGHQHAGHVTAAQRARQINSGPTERALLHAVQGSARDAFYSAPCSDVLCY
jgi:hypothetical protein